MTGGRHATASAADQFARAVDGGEPATDRATVALVAVADRLRAAATEDQLQPDAAFRRDLLARLAAEHRPSGAGATVVPLPVRRRHLAPPRANRVGFAAAAVAAACAIVAAVALVGAGGTRAPAAGVVGVPAGHARLAEAAVKLDQLIAARPPAQLADAASAGSSLAGLDAQVRAGVAITTVAAVRADDRPALLALAGWASGQVAKLRALAAEAGPAVAPRVRQSAALLARVQARAAALAGQAGCVCLHHPVVDDLGPVPCQRCDDPGSPPDPATLSTAALPSTLPQAPLVLDGPPSAEPVPSSTAPATSDPGGPAALPPASPPPSATGPAPSATDTAPVSVPDVVGAVGDALDQIVPGLVPGRRQRH